MGKIDNILGEEAKKNLIAFVDVINKKLEELWQKEIDRNFGFNKEQKDLVLKMLLHAHEHNMRPAKRIRGAFVVYGYMLGQKVDNIKDLDQRIWQIACGVELVHTALLMHDDFMDMDKVRRGKPTTQEYFANGDSHFGDCMAVCLGDAVLCIGYEMIQKSGFEAEKILLVMNQIQRGVTNTTFGQAYDTYIAKSGRITEENVLNLHRAKTAIYTYENPLLMGGFLSDLPDSALNILRDYSKNGGIAFQLQDDILGVYGDEEKTGKSVDSDLLQGKVTLMVVKTLEVTDSKSKEKIRKVWGGLTASTEEIGEVKEIMKDCGAYEYNKQKAVEYAQMAVESARKLRDLELNSVAIDFVEGVAAYMVERDV